MNLELKKYIEENYEEPMVLGSAPKPRLRVFKKLKKDLLPVNEDAVPAFECERASSINLDNYINDNKEYSDFQTTLFKMIDDRNLIDPDVYNKVHLDRRLFSKIRNDKGYHPSKETVLLLGLALELNEKEIEQLLDSASYSLPKNNYFDLILRFCFINKIYNILDVNNLLDEYNCKLFNY